jgi:hypothetical protein
MVASPAKKTTCKRRRKNAWGATMPQKQSAGYDLSKMSIAQVERLSLENARKIVKGKDNLKSWGRTGHILTRFGKLHYRSGLERDIFKALDGMNDLVTEIHCEAVIIPYELRGLKHHYVPDVLVKLCDSRVWLVEIKPKNQIKEEKNQAKFAAATEWCKKWGNHMRFCVISSKNPKAIREQLIQHDGSAMIERRTI